MYKFMAPILCAALLLAGCTAEAEPNTYNEPVITPIKMQMAQPSASVSQTPMATTDIDVANEHANTSSNIENGGTAVTDGEHIFIAEDKLYSTDLYCREKTDILDMADLCYLNVYEDWLYFVSAIDYNVYRVRKDGSNLTKLPVSGAFNLVVAGNSLFYQYAVGENADNLIYKTDLLGLNQKCLNINGANLCAGDTGLYFSNKDDNGYLYKYNFKEETLSRVRSDSARQINIIDGCLYYIASSEDNKIVAINPTGSGRRVIVNEPCMYLNHIKDSLVFSSEAFQGIEKINIDGTGRQVLLDYSDAHAFNTAGDYVFFESFPYPSMDAMTFRIKIDGTALNPDFPEQSLAIIKSLNTDDMTLELDYVELLTGDDAVNAYSYDNGLTKTKAREVLDNKMNGTYLRNQSPKLRVYKLTNLTGIKLLTHADGSYDEESYSASIDDFAGLYESGSDIIKSMIYNVIASNGEIISIEQQYYAGNSTSGSGE